MYRLVNFYLFSMAGKPNVVTLHIGNTYLFRKILTKSKILAGEFSQISLIWHWMKKKKKMHVICVQNVFIWHWICSHFLFSFSNALFFCTEDALSSKSCLRCFYFLPRELNSSCFSSMSAVLVLFCRMKVIKSQALRSWRDRLRSSAR